jgi:inosine/xanthosine triphosphate pyrophosphatase family protein
MKILIATHNSAKLTRYQRLLESVPSLELVSLDDIKITDKIDEPFENSRDNAVHKAKEFAKLSGLITIGIDEAVSTNFLPKGEQPGVYVRRLHKGGKEATDEQVLSYWRELFDKYDVEDKRFEWDFHVAYYNPNNEDLAISNVISKQSVTENFSDVIVPGYPMSSFLVMPGTTRPHSELTANEKAEADKMIFSSFVTEFGEWLTKQA